jgi:DNA polymerase-1
MSRTFLILDCNFLAYRLYHTMGELSHGAIKTGVVFGFLSSITQFQDQFGTDNIIFCFDQGVPKRRTLLPSYKEKRHAPDDKEKQDIRQHLHEQVNLLRTQYLPKIGYHNICGCEGYEADDIIASITQSLSRDDEAIIISADGDLYQLLDSNVSLYNPTKHKITTYAGFCKDRGVKPEQWARVRALAGCDTDEVPGIKGVGEETAIKFINNTLPAHFKSYKAICGKEGRETARRNKSLVQLPYKGTPTFEFKQDSISQEGWREVCDTLGIESLRDKDPISHRAKRKTNTFGL